MNLESTLDGWIDLWTRLGEDITPERAATVFARLADTPAPSQVARHTRGRAILEMLRDEPARRREGLSFEPNLHGSGAVALQTGVAVRKPVWWLTHLDTISYSIQRREGARYRLTPLCYHHARRGRMPGLALRYVAAARDVDTTAIGEVVTEEDGKAVYFETDTADLGPGTRIVYQSQARIDTATGGIDGNVDNAFACAAAYLAAGVLTSLRKRATGAAPDVLAAFPDEEEGVVADGNQAFCKGSLRLFNRTPPGHLPDLVVVSDVQEAGDMRDGSGSGTARMGAGATYSEVSSLGRGGIVPPALVGFQRELSSLLATRGILLQENGDGYVSRGDEVSAMLFTPNIAVIGFLGTHRHFDERAPTANLADLVHLAKTLVVYSLVAQDEGWRAEYLD